MHHATPSSISRRTVLAGSAAGLAAPMIGRPPPRIRPAMTRCTPRRNKKGKVVWWCGTYDQPTIQALRNAFMKVYPGVDVDFIWATGEVVYTRIQQNLQAGVTEVDIFCTSNAGHWPLLKKQNVATALSGRGRGRAERAVPRGRSRQCLPRQWRRDGRDRFPQR